MKPAVLVIDMIMDFTTGKLGSEAARRIRPGLARLLTQARRVQVPVFYCQDAHLPTDPELKVWGPHGMFGTPGAKTDPRLKPKPGEPVIPKHTLSAFFGTDLADQLQDVHADAVILTGVATEICVQNTAAEAFFRGYRLIVPRDATAGLTPENHERALQYMEATFGAKISDVKTVLRQLAKK